jgi:small subunit ribosomal protein S16
MIRIRLRRVGKKRAPYYRVVVANQQAKRDGAFLETLGSYDPHANPPTVQLDAERAKEWLSKGAQPSEAAEKILRRAGVLDAKPVATATEATATTATAVAEPPKKAAAKAAKVEAPEAEAAETEAPEAEAAEPEAAPVEVPAEPEEA